LTCLIFTLIEALHAVDRDLLVTDDAAAAVFLFKVLCWHIKSWRNTYLQIQ